MRPEAWDFIGTFVGVPTFLLLTFDLIFLIALIRTKHADVNVIKPYVYVMVLSGIVNKSAFLGNLFIHHRSSWDEYHKFIDEYGKQLGIVVQLSLFIPYSTLLLATFHRLSIVKNPNNQFFFEKTPVWLYLFVSFVPLITLYIVPFWTECPVFYNYEKVKAVASCLNGNHPLTNFITSFCTLNAIICFLTNFGITLHGRFLRDGTYIRLAEKYGIKHNMSLVVIEAVNPATQIMRRRRHKSMRQMGMGSSFMHGFYEICGLLIWLLENYLEDGVLEFVPFIGHLFIIFHNFITFLFVTQVTRVVIKNFFGLVGVYGIHNSTIIHVT